MNSKPYFIVTPALIRRANKRRVGRMVMYAVGALGVYGVLFVFSWLLVGLFGPNRPLDADVTIRSLGIAAILFYLGVRQLQRKGIQSWERVAQRSENRSGMRFARRGNFQYVQMGEAFLGLILAGPDWLRRIGEEYRNLIPASEEKANELEALRQNLAAREGWVPLKHFESHQEQIEELVALEIISIREILSEWHLHVTIQGTVRRREST